jgi:hypothetical protein
MNRKPGLDDILYAIVVMLGIIVMIGYPAMFIYKILMS